MGGVLSVRSIFDYYKKHDYKTLVMGASFRNCGQIKELMGCDLLTIAPKLLKQLEEDETASLDLKCNDKDNKCAIDKKHLTEPCAVDLLANGIVRFAKDAEKIDAMIKAK